MHVTDQIINGMCLKEKWLGVKDIKKEYKPRVFYRKDKDGRPIPKGLKAKKAAGYLVGMAWKTTGAATRAQ